VDLTAGPSASADAWRPHHPLIDPAGPPTRRASAGTESRLTGRLRAMLPWPSNSSTDPVADLSDTYMSQLERGLHEPSIRVLRALAKSLGIEPNQLIMYAAGLPLDQTEICTEDAIRRDDDDGLVVAVDVTNRAGFRTWLVTFLDRAEVLSPPELRAEIVTWLEDLAGGLAAGTGAPP